MEMLKAIEATFHRKSELLGHMLSLICDHINYNITHLLLPLKQKLKEKQKKLDDSQIDQLSALDLMARTLRGAPTYARMLVVRNAMAVAMQKTSGLVQEADFDEVRQQLRRLDLVANHQAMVKYVPHGWTSPHSPAVVPG